NHVPSNQAWFDPNTGSPTPTDCDGHGTHTMGTMTGWSPTTGDTVGVAPDAEWIAAKTICSSPITSNCIAAFQWAMDPDGNPGTITDMPDVISNSWFDSDVSNECSGIYKTTLDAVEAAGIAVIFSAGNNGPGASTITKPKNINTDEVNVFCTAAIDGASYLGGNNNPIASFSSRGPSLCGGTGSLLIKPEVSAPGVNVRSSYGSGGYANISGTSMASPHIAGAIALLKQFAPNLTGKQIKLALYNTAKDLGTPGEDNTYGRGLIDVYAAFLSLGTPDTTPPDPITDLSIMDPTSNSLTINWTVPNDTSANGVTGYDIRYSTSPINDTTAFNNATPVIFPGQPDTTGASESLVVDGLDFNTTYYFSIRSRDIWGNWSDLSNNASDTTYGEPAASVYPDSIHMNLVNNTTVNEIVTLSNTSAGTSTLDYDITLENNTFPEGMVKLIQVPKNSNIEGLNTDKDNPEQHYGQSIDGSGGPDAFGYSWIDSDEPNGPQYIWEDITTTGTAVTNWIGTGSFDPEDEGYAGPFPLGFNFKFYGNTKTQLYVSSNGLILFNTINTDIYINASIPDAAVPNEFIAPFWDDLDGRTQGTVHYKQDGNRFIIQFTNWQRYPATGSLTFQVVLYSSGKILVNYNNMNATLTSATVGIENQGGTIGLQAAYNAAYVHNNLALQFSAEPDWLGATPLSGRLYNGNSVDIDLEFRTEDFPLGDYSMDLVISSNDPVNSTITVPVMMTIVPIPVELTSLSAEAEKNSVTLKWITATETNNQGFSIERKDGKWKMGNGKWEKVGFIEGKGNTTEIQSYIFSEKDLKVGKYNYRLKQMDYDGSYEYSDEVEADISAPEEYTLKQNYPNPFNPMTIIEYSLPENAEVRIDIYNSLGEMVRTLLNNTRDAGYQKVSFDASSLPSGTYIYQIKAKGQTKTFVDSKKMLLVK
ncbi:MAG: S8 family serine peptidase, partial [Ignavibacteria bacterium]|nr:S8 family serine peptidase [Ignavibacteria bacterium]